MVSIEMFTAATGSLSIVGSIIATGLYLEKRYNNKMSRIARKFEEYGDQYLGKPEVTKYKRLGSPDVYAVIYHNSGHIIKTAEKSNIEESKDLREIDSQGKFNNCKIRTYPKMIM